MKYVARDKSIWHVKHDPPPIPLRTMDWSFWHDDYDGAPDACDTRKGYAASAEEAVERIDEMVGDNGGTVALVYVLIALAIGAAALVYLLVT